MTVIYRGRYSVAFISITSTPSVGSSVAVAGTFIWNKENVTDNAEHSLSQSPFLDLVYRPRILKHQNITFRKPAVLPSSVRSTWSIGPLDQAILSHCGPKEHSASLDKRLRIEHVVEHVPGLQGIKN